MAADTKRRGGKQMPGNTKNLNPQNLAQLQALYDLLQTGFTEETTIKEAISTLTHDSQGNGDLTKTLKDTWNHHQYPDKAIKYVQVSTYTHCPQLHEVSTEAQALFFLMLRLQHKLDGFVAVKKGIFAKALNLGSKRARKMQDYLSELLYINAISRVHEAPQGSTAPSIYRINSKLSKIGRSFHPQVIKKDDYQLKYSETYEKITVETIAEGKKEYICGTLEDVLNFKKRRASATNTDSTYESTAQDSSTQDNHNQQQQ